MDTILLEFKVPKGTAINPENKAYFDKLFDGFGRLVKDSVQKHNDLELSYKLSYR